MVFPEGAVLRLLGLNFAARGGVWSGRGSPGGGSGAGHRDGGWSVEVRAGPPPSAPGVPVTRQRGAAAGRAHPAAAAPGPSRVEVRRDRRRADPRARPGEDAWAEGAGAAPGGPWRVQGACLHVWGWQGEWVRGRVPVAVWALAPAVAGLGLAVRPSWFCLRGLGCAGLCVHARVCVEGPRVCICVCAGPSLCLARVRGAGLPRRSPSCAGMFSKQASCGDGLCCSRSWRGERRPHRPPETQTARGLQTDT